MDMNKTFFLRKEDRRPQWIVMDAKDQILGRLATRIADTLRGKKKAYFTPHTDAGDYVIVINAKDVKLTGKKMTDKQYLSYSGWIGGQKIRTPKEILAKHPTELVELAVRRMLPKNRLSRQIIKKLLIYPNETHPHTAQISKAAKAT